MIDITAKDTNYECTITCPEIIYNAFKVIRARLDHDPDVERHQMLKVVYPLDFGGPHHRYMEILNWLLEEHPYMWRIHSVHVRLEEKHQTVSLILRRHALFDLTEAPPSINPLEKGLYALFTKYAKTLGKDEVPNGLTLKPTPEDWEPYLLKGPAALTVFKNKMSDSYYYLYRVIFDLWEYNDEFPEVGWKACVDDYDEA
jgi:hypothetical protein